MSNIDTRNMEVGFRVYCPADRGEKGYWGTITHIGDELHKNIHGVAYRWITVRCSDGKSAHVWPSHRLGFNL